MLFSITTTHNPASDLGYLLHKHPERVQTFDLAFGSAHVFYSEVTESCCTANLLLEVNPISLVRGKNNSTFALAQYVNDRPYVASSFMSVAIAQVYGSALQGRSKDRPELVETPIPLTAQLSVVPLRGSEDMLRRLFEPLGYTVELERLVLDDKFPQWGMSRYVTLTLNHTIKLSELLSHLYVLIPVLDDDKHYYVGRDEIEKLLRHGEGWLSNHSAKDLITDRYLKHNRPLTREALALLVGEETADPDEQIAQQDAEEERVEKPMGLHQQRLGTVLSVLKQSGAESVLDLGCGEGRLLRLLLDEKQFTTILGMDVSVRSLEMAHQRMKFDRLPERQRNRIQLIHGSLMYRDSRLSGFDACAVVEVIEHLDPPRLQAFERVLFEFARPKLIAITTPNAEYNVMWESLPAGKFRHGDHRFEWTRAEFQSWAERICERFGYIVRIVPIGPEDEHVGSPSQMAVFEVRGKSI